MQNTDSFDKGGGGLLSLEGNDLLSMHVHVQWNNEEQTQVSKSGLYCRLKKWLFDVECKNEVA